MKRKMPGFQTPGKFRVPGTFRVTGPLIRAFLRPLIKASFKFILVAILVSGISAPAAAVSKSKIGLFVCSTIASVACLQGCTPNSTYRPDQLMTTVGGVPVVRAEPRNFERSRRDAISEIDSPDLRASDLKVLSRYLSYSEDLYPDGFVQKFIPEGVYVATLKPKYRNRFPVGLFNKLSGKRIEFFLRESAEVPAVLPTFHHELAHAVDSHYGDKDFYQRWRKLNRENFKYFGNSSSAMHEFDESNEMFWMFSKQDDPPWSLWEEGFAIKYSKSDLAEDIGTTAEVMFAPRFAELWPEIQRRAPILAEKCRLLAELYQKADSRITLDYILHVYDGRFSDFYSENILVPR